MSPSPPREDENVNRPKPVIAKIDFPLAQEAMLSGIGKCKELDEWLMGSGESAETAASNAKVTAPIQIKVAPESHQPTKPLA